MHIYYLLFADNNNMITGKNIYILSSYDILAYDIYSFHLHCMVIIMII